MGRRQLSILLIGLLSALTLLPPSANAQPAGCAPSTADGCPLAFGQSIQAAIADTASAVHLWRLTVPTSGSFAVVLADMPARYRLTVYPGTDEQSGSSKSTIAAGEYLFVDAPSPGLYTVRVDSPFSETSAAPYTLLAVRVLEVGNTVSSALTDPTGSQTWMVNVRSGGAFSISLTNLQVDYNIALYALNGTLIGRSEKPGADDDVITVADLVPGYYVLVVSALGALGSNPYRLTVVAGPPPAAGPVLTSDPNTLPAPAAPPSAASPSEADIAARVSPAVVQIVTPLGKGSGVKIAQGVLTNDHVVSGADRVDIVRSSDGRQVTATPVRCDPVLDLALLAVDLDLPTVDLAPARSQRQGDPVLVLGFPLSDVLTGPATLTRGLISAFRQDERGELVVQTDAAVNPGNSGGAMINGRGELIALPSSTLVGRAVRGISFGIASESIQGFLAGPDKPCSNGAAPNTVLLSDTFDNPMGGVLPLSSLLPNRFASRYLDGEYQLQLVDTTWSGLPTAIVPGAYTDASLGVDARIAGEVQGRVLAIGCRDPDGSGGYALFVEPGRTRAILARFDSNGSASSPIPLIAWRSLTDMRSGDQPNRLELSCVGSNISGTVNGTLVGTIRDTRFVAGQMWLATLASSGTVDARFDNLVVTRR